MFVLSALSVAGARLIEFEGGFIQPVLQGNHGVISVAAPWDVYTTLPGDKYGPFYGTSAATPIVTGLAGLLLSYDNSLSASDIKNYIVQGAEQRGVEPVVNFPNSTTANVIDAARSLELAANRLDLTDISNWTITNGIASMNGAVLTVGPDGTPYSSPFGGLIRSNQSFSQPFTFTWKGFLPETDRNSVQAGMGQEPFALAGYPTENIFVFYTQWDTDGLLRTNPQAVVVPSTTLTNRKIYGEFTISWRDDKISSLVSG